MEKQGKYNSQISEFHKEKLKSMEMKSIKLENATKEFNSATLELKKAINDLKKINSLTFNQWKINKSQLELTLN